MGFESGKESANNSPKPSSPKLLEKSTRAQKSTFDRKHLKTVLASRTQMEGTNILDEQNLTEDANKERKNQTRAKSSLERRKKTGQITKENSLLELALE